MINLLINIKNVNSLIFANKLYHIFYEKATDENVYLIITYCGLVAPQLRLRRQRPRVEPSKTLRCLTAGAGYILRIQKERGRYFVHALSFLYCPRFLWAEVRFAFIVCCAFWFCTLVIEGSALKLLQAFRERLEPKLFSLALLPHYVVALPAIMN
jgi:hypothetical protein